eukprot:scaffold22589_cov138-Cylindrotheca_fusiformis.AAC.62
MSAALTTARATMIMPKSDKSELKDLPMESAKPSAIREAAKQKRLANQAERNRIKERQRREAEQQMKMQRYRDEIAAIKANQNGGKEVGTKEVGKKDEKKAVGSELAKSVAEKAISKEVTSKRESAVLGYSTSTSEMTDCSSDDDEYKPPEDFEAKKKKFAEMASPKTRGRRVMHEMKGSFRKLKIPVIEDSPKKSASEDKSTKKAPSLPAIDSAMVVAADSSKQLETRRQGSDRSIPSSRNSLKKQLGPTRNDSVRSSANFVPEMRRRPMQRDLLFDDEQVKIASERGNTKVFRGISSDYRRASMSALNTKMLSDKQQKEKEEIIEQRKKLEEAQKFFDKGHNLCWEIHDSASALGEYRQALFIRESLLGKYHEQTGRTYFWIGKSLAKLEEFSEALVAFSRAMRIFERVVRKNHKYHKWSLLAIKNCIEGMGDEDIDVETYQASLNASIKYEREGDSYRKKGDLAKAVASYRDAIDTVDEYHPDAADLYCKVAMILRQNGDFDRALEEYRFASEIYELSLGADHPETVKAINQVMEKKRLGQLSNMLKDKLNLQK